MKIRITILTFVVAEDKLFGPTKVQPKTGDRAALKLTHTDLHENGLCFCFLFFLNLQFTANLVSFENQEWFKVITSHLGYHNLEKQIAVLVSLDSTVLL